MDQEADMKPVVINDEKENVKTVKDEGNFEAFYNKDNTTMTQINTLDESVWMTFVNLLNKIFELEKKNKGKGPQNNGTKNKIRDVSMHFEKG